MRHDECLKKWTFLPLSIPSVGAAFAKQRLFLVHQVKNDHLLKKIQQNILPMKASSDTSQSDLQRPILPKPCEPPTDLSTLLKLSQKQWWFLVSLNIAFVIIGQTSAVLLNRLYYAHGGKSPFMSTLAQTAGFPLLLLPKSSPPPLTTIPRKTHTILIFIFLGILLALDNLLYSIGLRYLSASTYSLISSSQLAFTAFFSFLINSQKLTPLIINSVIIVSLSTILLALTDISGEPSGGSRVKFAVGFLCAVGDSAVYTLFLSLTQLAVEKVLKSESFAAVIEMQVYVSMVAAAVSAGGVYVSGEWVNLAAEMRSFDGGVVMYGVCLGCVTVACQVCAVGAVGLIYLVSCLFSNVINTVAYVVTPVVTAVVFGDKMDGVKIVAMVQSLWGFASYLYQNYLDDKEVKSDEFEIA